MLYRGSPIEVQLDSNSVQLESNWRVNISTVSAQWIPDVLHPSNWNTLRSDWSVWFAQTGAYYRIYGRGFGVLLRTMGLGDVAFCK